MAYGKMRYGKKRKMKRKVKRRIKRKK